MSDQDISGEFWTFSLSVYGQPGVEAACLRLQSSHQMDVNVVLFCAWAGVRGIALDDATLAGQIAGAAEWQAHAVQPIRAIRRRLKDFSVAGLSHPQRDELREAIKSVELQAEKLEQTILANTLAGQSPGDSSAALLDANFEAYWCITAKGDQTEATAAWRIIRAAAFAPALPSIEGRGA